MTLRCPLCGSDNVRYDERVDEYYCGTCGYVFKKSDVDIESFVPRPNVTLGSVFNGKNGKYKRLKKMNNKNDINTYRILQLQKIKSFVVSHGLPITIYDWVVRTMKSMDNVQWRFSYIVAVLYLGIIKYGFYRNIDDFVSYFDISKKVLWRQIHKASKDLGIDYVMDDATLAKIFVKKYNDYCMNCCIDYLTKKAGGLSIRYGSSPRVFAYTHIFLCEMYCKGNVGVSNFMKTNNVPRNSLNQNLIRILKEFGIEVDEGASLRKKDIKKYLEVIFDGACCKSSRVD